MPKNTYNLRENSVYFIGNKFSREDVSTPKASFWSGLCFALAQTDRRGMCKGVQTQPTLFSCVSCMLYCK